MMRLRHGRIGSRLLRREGMLLSSGSSAQCMQVVRRLLAPFITTTVGCQLSSTTCCERICIISMLSLGFSSQSFINSCAVIIAVFRMKYVALHAITLQHQATSFKDLQRLVFFLVDSSPSIQYMCLSSIENLNLLIAVVENQFRWNNSCLKIHWILLKLFNPF